MTDRLSPTFEADVERLVELLYHRYHYDFRRYTRSSLRRRLANALSVNKCESIDELLTKLEGEPNFLNKLLDGITVPTTEMFRDPSYFKALRTHVVPYLKTYPSVKVWVAGCSTGEEVYSLAILLDEEGLLPRTLFYATDINPRCLERAGQGIYSVETIRQATQNYQRAGGKRSLSDYYEAAYGSVRLDPRLRANVVFSDHSLATDTVFAEVNLVSCRNVLIYFERELQDRAIGLFKDSLDRHGFMGLGNKESLLFSEHRESFTVLDRESRVFQKNGGPR